jgi:transposase InsO family protein
LLWVLLSRVWPRWLNAIVIVKPETVVGWHRQLFRRAWAQKSRHVGRPALSSDVRTLIRSMSEDNPLWGAPRIHGELLKLGIDVSQSTVAKYMVRQRKPPSQTWRTFLDNYVTQLMAADFFVVPTATCRLLFVLVILAHDRRRVVHTAVTARPNAAWTAQQFREAFPWDQAPRFLIHDRDLAFQAVAATVRGMGTEEVLTAPHSPWQNAYAERFIGSVRRECLDHVASPVRPGGFLVGTTIIGAVPRVICPVHRGRAGVAPGNLGNRLLSWGSTCAGRRIALRVAAAVSVVFEYGGLIP